MKHLFVIAAAAMAMACGPKSTEQPTEQPTVYIDSTAAGYQMVRMGQPYFVQGGGGSSHASLMAELNGNSMRTWGTYKAQQVLDSAAANGLTVQVGLGMSAERHGMDYRDSARVAAQLEKARADVRKYKDHPALLSWALGNELDLNYTDTIVWLAVEQMAQMVKEEDPNHPVMPVLAGITQDKVEQIIRHCPSVDLLGINAYGDLENVPAKVKDYGWTKPYVVTEWGPTGHWERPKTEWGAAIEQTSGEKADAYTRRYKAVMETDPNCLGSYAFVWGQKQERTPTWYSMFMEDGTPGEVVYAMAKVWGGAEGVEQAPSVHAITVNNTAATESLTVPAASELQVALEATPGTGEASYKWFFMKESTDLGEGGDRESRPQELPAEVLATEGSITTVRAPEEPGAYRVFVYLTDNSPFAAYANFPFLVE